MPGNEFLSTVSFMCFFQCSLLKNLEIMYICDLRTMIFGCVLQSYCLMLGNHCSACVWN